MTCVVCGLPIIKTLDGGYLHYLTRSVIGSDKPYHPARPA